MNKLKKDITLIRESCSDAIKKSSTLDDLEAVRVEFLGRKGKISELMPFLKDLSVEDRKSVV